MTKEEIIGMAYKANLPFHYLTGKPSLWHELKQFAKLVAEKERETCALMVMPLDESLADEIRQRGQE
jgi:hypothetical protein